MDNETYKNVQFFLLDYSSGDGLEQYVLSNWIHYIESEGMIYYQVSKHLFLIEVIPIISPRYRGKGETSEELRTAISNHLEQTKIK
jgi:hypothetical protein